jgi:hypothetical protein
VVARAKVAVNRMRQAIYSIGPTRHWGILYKTSPESDSTFGVVIPADSAKEAMEIAGRVIGAKHSGVVVESALPSLDPSRN